MVEEGIHSETQMPQVRTRNANRAAELALRQYAEANKLANALSRDAAAAKKALHQVMAETGVTEVEATIDFEGTPCRFAAKIAPIEKEVIDVNALKDLVDGETFLRIVKATKTDVTKYAGTNVLLRTLTVETQPEDLIVKEVKG